MCDEMTRAFIVGRVALANGYDAVEIKLQDGLMPHWFEDGALVDVALAGVVRTYPLCRSPLRPQACLIGVRTASHFDVKPLERYIGWRNGDEILVTPPRKAPLTIDQNARYILLGGGLGLAAVADIARRLAGSGKTFELHNFARTSDRALFPDGLDELRSYGKVYHHIGRSAEGIAQSLSNALGPTHANTQIYCSAPPSLMDSIEFEALQWVYEKNVHKIFLGDVRT